MVSVIEPIGSAIEATFPAQIGSIAQPAADVYFPA
jgi:hypothetical protein